MSQNLTKTTCLFILGLLIGCSGGGNDSPETVVVGPASAPAADDSTPGTNADTGNVNASAGDTTAAGATSGMSADAGSTTAGAGTATGTATSGASTGDGGETAGTATDGSTDAVDTTAGTSNTSGASDGASDASGTTSTETTTDTAGVTAGTATEGAVDTVGTTTTGAGVTAGTTDAGTTAGTDADGGGTGTTTAGQTLYPPGSLAYKLQIQPDLSSALAALQKAGLDEAINNSLNEWTLFLPTNEAFEALDSQSDFDLLKHRAGGVFSLFDLSNFNGLKLKMDDDRPLTVYGDGSPADPLTIADATVITPDIVGDTGLSVVHVIDKVIGDYTGPEYPRDSLANALVERGDMSIVLNLLKGEEGRDIMLVDPGFEWTLFLPNDTALEREFAQEDFLGDNHIYDISVLKERNLTGLSGNSIEMFGGDLFEIGGGGTEPLTIGGVDILESDLQREDMEGVVVHIIDGVLVPPLIQGD